jgi:hypothetical protein
MRHGPTGARVIDRDDNAESVSLTAGVLAKADGLGHIGQYTFGIPDFTVDVLDDLDAAAATGTERLLAQTTALGRDLYDYMIRFNSELTPARTGHLIRFFLSAGRGAVHWDEIAEGQHLVGVSLPAVTGRDDASVFAAERANDRAVAELANELRRRLSQRPLDYGGWLALAETAESVSAPPAPAAAESDDPVAPSVGPGPAEMAALCSAALDHHDLHYVAIYDNGEAVASGDVLHHAALRRFAAGTTVEERRRFYAGFGSRIRDYAKDLAPTVFPVVGRHVNYFVLDVERGAVYYHRVRPGTYVFAVTLDQDRVATAESKVADLARRLSVR